MKKLLSESFILSALKRFSPWQDKFEKSWIFALFSNGFQWIFRLFNKLFDSMGGYSSITYKYLLKYLFSHYHILVGGFIMLMIISPHSLWNNTYGLIGVVLLLFLFVLKVSVEKSAHFPPISLPFVLFAIAAAMGFMISADKSDALRVFLFYMTALMLTYTVMAAVRNEKTLRGFLICLWLGLMIVSLFGVYQGIVGVEVNLSYTDTTLNAGMSGRVYSTFENPNNFAELIVLLVPFTVALALSFKGWKPRVFFLLSLALPVMAIGYTLSRSGWVALACVIFVFALLYKPIFVVPIVVLGLVALPFLPQDIKNRALTIGSMNDSSNKYRTYIWGGAWKIIENYGLTGIGLGPANFGLIYPSFANPAAINARHSHMLYMQSIIEMGILGFVSVMWCVLGTMKNSWAAAKAKWARPICKYTAFATISAMCGMGFMAMAEYIWYYPRVLFMFFVCLGVGCSTINMVKAEAKHKGEK